jgi:hypothetical protein
MKNMEMNSVAKKSMKMKTKMKVTKMIRLLGTLSTRKRLCPRFGRVSTTCSLFGH